MANDKIRPVGIYSQHGAFLTVTDLMELLKVSRFVVDRMPFLLRYVTLLEERVIAPQRLFCLSSLPECKYLTHSKKQGLKA